MTGLTKLDGYGITVGSPYADKFKGLLDDLAAAGVKIDPRQSGGYNYRNIAGTNRLSNHAYGRALDVNWTDNARGTPGKIDPTLARTLAQKHGMVWGGDWSNPDPMHFEIAGALNAAGGQHNHSHGTTPTPTSPPGTAAGAAPMAYAGATPDSVAQARGMAKALMSQGLSGQPVQHWTQALGRVLQAGVGSMWDAQANTGEKEGKASANAALAQALAGDPKDPQAAISALSGNPWTQDMGQELTKGLIASRFTKPKQTDDIVEWEAAGKPGTLQDWIRGNKAAGATRVSTEIKGENKFEEKSAEFQVKRLNEYIGEGETARTQRSDLGTLRELSRNLGSQGMRAPIAAALGPYAEAAGIKIDGLSEIQAFQSIVSRMAPQMRPPGSGATSDFEFKQFMNSLPQLAQTPEGREMVHRTLDAMAEYKEQRAEIASKVLNKELDRTEGEKMLRALPSPFAFLKQSKGQAPPPDGDGWMDVGGVRIRAKQ
jgi:hypothetical protein